MTLPKRWLFMIIIGLTITALSLIFTSTDQGRVLSGQPLPTVSVGRGSTELMIALSPTCPACKRHQALAGEFIDTMLTDGQLRLGVYPITHGRDRTAALGIYCAASEDKLGIYLENLYEFGHEVAEQSSELGETYKSCMARDDTWKRIQSGKENLKQLGVTATPAFILKENGAWHLYQGVKPLSWWQHKMQGEG